MKRLLVGVAALTAASTVALADGMPGGRAAVYAPQFSWTGLYVGAHGGWERKDMKGSDSTGANDFPFANNFTDGSSSLAPTQDKMKGYVFGGQIGYNHQFGHVVVGTELSGTFGDVSGSRDCFQVGRTPLAFETSPRSCSAEQDWSVQWLNKLGVTFGGDNRFLAYLTGGVAVTNVAISRSVAFTRGPNGNRLALANSRQDWSGSSDYIGVVLGAGFQYAFTHNLSLGAEWLHTTYGSADTLTTGSFVNNLTGFSSGRSANAINDLSADTVRVVLNYKFGDRTVVAAPLK